MTLPATDTRMREALFKLSPPTAWPRGVECIIDYDGYVLNDLRRPDKIVVESIGGLAGPDLSAEAEKSPGSDGETPYDASYGGWTITLRLRVDAGTLDTMRALYSYLLEAFDDVSTERRLWFRYLDWVDLFLDGDALVDYALDAGAGTVSVSPDGLGLVASSSSEKSLVLRPITPDRSVVKRYTYGDGEAILRFTVAAGVSSPADDVVGVEARRSSASRKLRLVYTSEFEVLRLQKVDGGVVTELASDSLSVVSIDEGRSYWVRLRCDGGSLSGSIWDLYPPDVGGDPLASVEHELSPSDSMLYPSLDEGLDWGLYWRPNTLGPAGTVEMLDVGAIDKGDAVIWCRKGAQVEGEEVQEDERFKRSLAVALRASYPRMQSRKVSVVSATPDSYALTFPADGSGLEFPADGSGLVFGGYLSSGVVNLGRSTAAPVVRLHGPLSSAVVYAPRSDTRIGATGSIGVGDYYEFDCARRTVRDSAGASAYRYIDDSTTWIVLDPGLNEVIIGADSIVSDVVDIAANVTASIDRFDATAHGIVADQKIVVAPLPFQDVQVVYARDVLPNSFKVSATRGGPVLDIPADATYAVWTTIGSVEFIYRHSSR